MLAIFISLTIIFLILAAISALILSYFALLALTVGMVVVGPLVVVVGGIPEFHWVYGTWIRAFVGVLLVPLANAILFKMLSVFSLQGKSIVDILVGMGFLCIIVAVNFYAGKLVFSPAIEAGKMAAELDVPALPIGHGRYRARRRRGRAGGHRGRHRRRRLGRCGSFAERRERRAAWSGAGVRQRVERRLAVTGAATALGGV